MYDLEEKINFSVFPGHQGGPHNHTITALAVALRHAASPEFKDYQKLVLENAQSLASSFSKLGYDIVSGGTDTHMLLLDLRSKGVDGARVERVLELVDIAANKNTVPGDRSALIPSGLRLGTPAMTTRGLTAKDFETVATLVDRAVEIAKMIKAQVEGKKLSDFKAAVGPDGAAYPEIAALRKEVVDFARSFPVAGFIPTSS